MFWWCLGSEVAHSLPASCRSLQSMRSSQTCALENETNANSGELSISLLNQLLFAISGSGFE